MLKSVAVAGAAMAIAGGSVRAQMCAGFPNFAGRPLRLGATAEFGNSARAYSGEGAVGVSSGFLGASVGTVNYDGFDETATIIDVNGGISMPLNPEKSLEFCPLASFSHQSGPNSKTTSGSIDFSSNSFGLGGVIGGVVSSSSDLQIIPFGGAMITWDRGTSKIGSTSSNFSDTFKSAQVGLGLVINKVITIRPRIQFPLAEEDADPVFGIGFSYSFGTGH